MVLILDSKGKKKEYLIDNMSYLEITYLIIDSKIQKTACKLMSVARCSYYQSNLSTYFTSSNLNNIVYQYVTMTR